MVEDRYDQQLAMSNNELRFDDSPGDGRYPSAVNKGGADDFSADNHHV